jgi:hypothetical protein
LAADQGIAEARLVTVAHGGDVPQPHRRALAGADHRCGQRIEGRARRLGADHDALHRRLDVAAADQGGGALRRGDHLIQREARRRELHRVHLDLPLAHLAAEDLRLRDSGNGENLRLHDPLHGVAQLDRGQAVAGVAEVDQILHRG